MQKMNELFEKVAKDKDLQAKYIEIIQDSLKSGKAATYEKLVVFAKDAGCDIAIDEMKEYFNGMTASKERELEDSELDKVAGGRNSRNPGFNYPGGDRFILPGDTGPLPSSFVIVTVTNECI